MIAPPLSVDRWRREFEGCSHPHDCIAQGASGGVDHLQGLRISSFSVGMNDRRQLGQLGNPQVGPGCQCLDGCGAGAAQGIPEIGAQ